MLCRNFVVTLLLAVSIGAFPGCGKKNNSGLIDVRGDVQFDGKPIERGTIAFTKADRSNIFSGNIKDGRFTIGNSETGQGVPPGTYHVSFSVWETAPGMGQAGKEAIPQKYFDPATSGLEVEVSPEKMQHNFELKP
ncbi:hypothetical protein SH661x_002653 [Planctomicrobium sp. SH661]|uniref:hypothetical protein n=1 Tax=Planctomicrobium sp. SH661 TaxID=3448124 RepID=UPI003F5C2E4B